MIIDLLVSVALGILNAMLSLLPTYTPVSDSVPRDTEGNIFVEWVDRVAGFLVTWDQFVPVRAFFTAVLAVLAARVFAFAVQFILWVWESLPFKST